jgi:zinc protease
VVVEGPGETSYVELAYRGPAAGHPDFWPMAVLDSLLAGASSPSVFGGGISNKTSRLYRALVEQELAVNVGGDLLATLDPFIYSLTIVVTPDGKPEPAIAATEAEITACKIHCPDGRASAGGQQACTFAYSGGISNQAVYLVSLSWFRTGVVDGYLTAWLR